MSRALQLVALGLWEGDPQLEQGGGELVPGGSQPPLCGWALPVEVPVACSLLAIAKASTTLVMSRRVGCLRE